MDTKFYLISFFLLYIPVQIFTEDTQEKIDNVSELDKDSPITFTDCLKSKQIQIKKSDGLYMIRVMFSGKARSVIVPGEEGVFEILAFHKPILSRLLSGILYIDRKRYPIERGIIKVNNDKVTIIVEERLQNES